MLLSSLFSSLSSSFSSLFLCNASINDENNSELSIKSSYVPCATILFSSNTTILSTSLKYSTAFVTNNTNYFYNLIILYLLNNL